MLIQRITARYHSGNFDKAIALLQAERKRLIEEGDPHNLSKSRPHLVSPWHIADTSIAEYEFENVDDMRATWARWEASDAGKAFMQAYAPMIEPGMTTELFDVFPGQPPRDPLKPGSLVQRLTVRYKVGTLQDACRMLVAESQRCRKEGISSIGDARYYMPWSITDTSVGEVVFPNAGEIEKSWATWAVNSGTANFLREYGPLSMGGHLTEINKVL